MSAAVNGAGLYNLLVIACCIGGAGGGQSTSSSCVLCCLLCRHNLLQAWCECLSLIQVNKMEHCATWDGSAGLTQEFERLLEAEVALLNQLTSSPACSLQDAAGLMDVGMDTIAPAGDPMSYFKHHISQTPMANAATMTRQDMAELMRESTLQLSVQLHILQESPPDQHAAAIVQLQAAFDR